jgi:outer membrane receptor protein involved in Fe transport
MSKIGLFLCSLFFSFALFGQYPGGRGMGGNNKTGHVFGKIVDEKGQAIPMVNILLLQNKTDSITKIKKDVVLKSTTTENNGEFSIEDVKILQGLKIKVAFYGFETIEKPFFFDPADATTGLIERDLGNIVFKEIKVNELEELEITAIQSTLKLDVDKKVFNVGQNTMSEGGTATDVMKNVPGVNVDMDGNVSLRNSSPQIFLDGRPTTLTLDQIPAESIESIEIITNPSAKYDASGGGGGILNIVLKKNKKTGYNGGVRLGINQFGGGNIGADFNLRQNKINFTGSLMSRLNNGVSFGTVDRTNYLNGSSQTILNQDNVDKSGGGGYFGKIGIDYMITNRTTISFSANNWRGTRNSISDMDIYTDTVISPLSGNSFSKRNTDNQRGINNYGLVFGMKHLFQKSGEEWTFDANYNRGRNHSDAIYRSDFYATDENSGIERFTSQKIKGIGNEDNLVLQTDYVRPMKFFKLETGLRAAMRKRTNVNENYILNQSTNLYDLVYSPASNYNNDDNVYAAYATISKQYKTFGYKVGLRAESSNYSGVLTNTGEKFGNTYPISLFPSLFLTKTLPKDQDLQLSVTRRIERPNFRQLIPFVDSVDQFNISRGNPDLRPEFTQAFELSYMKRFKNRNTFLASVYYKYTDNLITRYIEQASNGALINTYINANSSYATGLELTSQNYLTKWWDISSNLNVYNSKINVTQTDAISQAALWSWFAKLNSNFRLPANFSVQLSAFYQSKTNIPTSGSSGGQGYGGGGGPGGGGNMQAQSASQGYIKAFYAVDIAVKKTFMKNKMSISINVNDIFRTRYSVSHSFSAYFEQDYSRISNPQMVRLNFTYTFGKIDAVLFKRKSQGTGEDITQ